MAKTASPRAPKKKSAYTPAERAAQKYTGGGAYNITDGKLRKVQGAFAAKLVGDTFTAAAGYTPEYSNFAKANPGLVAPVKLGGIGTYDPATRKLTLAGNQKSVKSTKSNKSLGGHLADEIGRTGPTAAVFPTAYAEGDLTRTGTAAAQGKAYQLSQQMYGTDAGTVLGATSVPSVAQTLTAGEAGASAGARRKTASKAKGKRKGKRAAKK